MTAPQPGQVWQDRDHRIPADRRRLVEVTAADHSFVEGRGWWQRQRDGRWVDDDGPVRRTRIRTGMFMQRYSLHDQETSR